MAEAPKLQLTGDAARILLHVARESPTVPPPDEQVSVRERTPREYLAGVRSKWIVAALLSAVLLACLVMLASAGGSTPAREAELAAQWFATFAATLVIAALIWRGYRALEVLALGPLDAPGRGFRVEAAALIVESADGETRRLDFAALTRCEVAGHQSKHGWQLASLTLDDGAGSIELRAAWLPSERVLVALADRLLRSGRVTVLQEDQ